MTHNDSKTILLEKILFYQVSYVFLVSNILIAHLGSGLSLPILAIRDSWMLTLAILIIIRVDLIGIFLLSSGILFGVLPIFAGNQFIPLIFLHGLRDLFLIVFVFYILRGSSFRANRVSFKIFSLIVISLSALQLAFQIFGFGEYDEFLFRTSEYFAAKGVESNVEGGIFGVRLTAPFYSASILATFLVFLTLIPSMRASSKILIISFSMFTVSKVIPLALYFLALKNKYIVAAFLLIIALTNFPFLLSEFISNSEPSIITFHAASVMDRFNYFSSMSELSSPYYNQMLGSGSVAAAVLMNGDPSSAPESILIARVVEYGYFSFFLFLPILLMYFAFEKRFRYLFITFLFIILLSGLSNHPICYLAFAFLSRDFQRVDSGRWFSFPSFRHRNINNKLV
jgi:hypothetical protein